jgi:hypothetical protein
MIQFSSFYQTKTGNQKQAIIYRICLSHLLSESNIKEKRYETIHKIINYLHHIIFRGIIRLRK